MDDGIDACVYQGPDAILLAGFDDVIGSFDIDPLKLFLRCFSWRRSHGAHYRIWLYSPEDFEDGAKSGDVCMVVLNAGDRVRYLLGLSAEYGDG